MSTTSLIGSDFIQATQKSYSESLDAPDGSTPNQPLPSNVLEQDDTSNPITTKHETTKYRSDLGAYAYLASTTRPDLSYSATFSSRYNQQPTQRARRLLDAALRYAKETANVSLMIKKPHAKELRLTCHCDASFGSANSPYPQSGFVIMHEGAPLVWKSHKQKRVARSTTRAELLALEEAIDYMVYIKPFLKLFWSTVHLEAGTDSADLVALLQAVHPHPTERALIHRIRAMHGKLIVVPLYALAETVVDERIIVFKVHTKDNVADALTKPMPVSALYDRLLPVRSPPPQSDEVPDDITIIDAPQSALVKPEAAHLLPTDAAPKRVLRSADQRRRPQRLIDTV